MANETEILIVNGVEYTLIDSTAVHTVDSGLSASSSNPVKNSVITAEVNKKPTLLKFGPYTATLTGEYYTFPFSYIDIGGIAASHDGIVISFSSSSAFRPNSTIIGFKNEASMLNGVNVNAYSGTISKSTEIDSNTFVCILPTSGTSSGGTGYVKEGKAISTAIEALDATISGLGTGKTITALSETNGVISATASNIAIAGSQVTSGTIAEARLPYSYVKKAGDTMDGPLQWTPSSLPKFSSAPQYLVGIDAFADGGTMKWYAASNTTIGTATKLGTATVGSDKRPIYLNAGTPTAMNPGEAFLSWGGQNLSANNSPLDAALINTLGADRFAFIPAACATVEYSTDAGATWQDYGLSDSNKVALFAPGLGTAVYLGKHTTAGSGTTNDQLRITVDTYYGDQRVYSIIKKFVMYGSTNGAAGTTWSLQVRTTANVLNNVDTWVNVFTDVAWGGWSGINIAQTDITIGSNAPTSTSNTQYRQFRLIFKQGTPSASNASSQILYIMGYGGFGWKTPSNMAKYNSLYAYDYAQNATFPARVKATELKGLGANYYGICTTAAGTAAKVVTCTDFVLVTGARISVKFTNGSTSTGTMSLNVNGTGIKNCGIYLYNGTWQTYANRCEKNTILEFVYDGTYWVTITPYALRNYAGYNSRLTSANVSLADFGLQYFLATSSMTTGKPPTDAAILNMNWDNGTIWGHQLAVGNGTGRVFTRAQNGSTAWGDWKELPRLSSTPTNGQIIVSDESTSPGLVKGITYDYKLTLFTTFTDVDADTISFSLSNDQLTGLNDYMSGAVSGGYTGMVHVSFTAPLPNSDTHDAVYIAHSALLDEYDMKWVFSGTVYDSVDKTTYPFTFSYPIASTGPVTATVKLNRASSGGGSLDPVEDSDVFLSRAVNFGENKYKFPSLVGGTVAWNQLWDETAIPSDSVIYSSTTYTANGVTFTKNGDGSISIQTVSTGATANTLVKIASSDRTRKDIVNAIQKHTHLISGAPFGSATTYSIEYLSQNVYGDGYLSRARNSGFNMWVAVRSGAVIATAVKVYPQIFDLDITLGTTITTYMNSLGVGVNSAGVNWFKQYFRKSYYPYNPGALISVNPTGAETTGVNAWDEEWEYGEINSTTGANNGSATTAWRTKNYIPVIPGGTYYVTAPVASKNLKARFYDASKNYIGYTNKAGTNCFTTTAFTVPDNASYVRFGPAVSDIAVPNNNICVSISNPLYNGTYYPYAHHSYPISPVELRGIPKLTDGKLAFDGDVRASDGTVTRKYGIVDMGTLSWRFTDQVNSIFQATITEMQAPATTADRLKGIVSSKYPVDTVIMINENMGDKTMKRAGSVIYIRDTAYTTAAAFKTAMSGVYLVYELATPTTESSQALPVPQVVYDGGTESYIDERDVQVPVGQDATYMDATSAIGELMDSGLVPSSGGGSSESEGTFTVTDGVGSSDTWSYYKIGKQVTVSGKYTGSSTALSLQGLPFAVKFKQVFFLPVQVTSPSIQLYSCQVTLTANATTIGTYGYGTSATSSWLSFAKSAGTQITFSYITDD